MALAKKPFVVLDAEILSSSVWSEAAHVRLVWITLLILCDTEGYVGASLPGIARAAGVSLEEAQEAMRRLAMPDAFSRTKANDGRRVEVAERGFRVLNFLEHLDRMSTERSRARERVRRFRDRKRKGNGNVTETPETLLSAQGEGNSEQGIGTREQGPEKQPTNIPPAPNGASSPKGDHSEGVLRIFDHWRQKLSPKAKLSPKRKRLILARLGDGYSPEDLCRAIDGCAVSPFHNGENPTGTKYHELTLILRDAEHVDAFMEKAPVIVAPRPKTSWEVLGITEEEWRRENAALGGAK